MTCTNRWCRAPCSITRPTYDRDGRAADGQIALKVHIVDSDGVPWEAIYTLERQSDGSLKITGCMLLKTGQGV